MQLFFGTCLLFILILAELLFLKIQNREIPWSEVAANLNSGHIVLWIFRGVEIIIYAFVYRHLTFDMMRYLPPWLMWITAFILWDLCFYWLHRLHHSIGLFWKVHRVHHQGTHFSLSLGVRNSWYSSLTSIPFFIPMALLGVSPEIFVIMGGIHYFIQFYNHNSIVRKSGFLDHVMITPSHHRVHHGTADIYHNKNFGGCFVWWDHLFGTFQKEDPAVPELYGLNEFRHVDDVIVMNHQGTVTRPDYRKEEKVIIPDFVLFVGACILFLHLLYFIYYEKLMAAPDMYLLFFLIVLATILLGKLNRSSLRGFNFSLIFQAVLYVSFTLLFAESLMLRLLLLFYLIYCLILLVTINTLWRKQGWSRSM